MGRVVLRNYIRPSTSTDAGGSGLLFGCRNTSNSLLLKSLVTMKLISGLATLVSIAAAAPSMVDRASSPLNVKLEKAGNSAIKATISNVGHEDLRIFRPGSIFDSSSVEKAKVKAGGEYFVDTQGHDRIHVADGAA